MESGELQADFLAPQHSRPMGRWRVGFFPLILRKFQRPKMEIMKENSGIEGEFDETGDVLVTGASRGIGLAIAQELAKAGHRLIIVARAKEDLDVALASLPVRNKAHSAISADLMSHEGRQLLQSDADLENISAVVHNMGGSLGVTDFWASNGDYKSVWDFNLGAAHELNRLIVPAMVSRGWGRIIFISTLAVRLSKGNPPYTIAKAGLESYIKLLARHLEGTGVVAAGVRPGAIRVSGRYLANLEESNPEEFQRWLDENNSGVQMGSPSEIASVVGFLCSRGSSYLSGSIIDADGGV